MKKRMKWFLRIGGGLIVLLLLATVIFWKNIREISEILKYARLFEAKHMVENFRTMYEKYPYHEAKRAGAVYELPLKKKALPETYTTKGETKSVAGWIEHTGTTGFLVMRNGSIVFEEYYQGTEESTMLISMSVGKSILSFLIGAAVENGLIDLQTPVDSYVPELKGSGYEGVSVKDVLQMSSGIRFNEDYHDLNSDFVRMIAAFTSGSLKKYLCTLEREKEPGTYQRYISTNSQILGWVLANVTGKSVAEYTEEKLWSRIGAQADSLWLTDPEGVELTTGGFCATLRDFARFGMLYLNNGRNYRGEQLVSEEWVTASHTPDAYHLMPGEGNTASDEAAGYGYHWWLPPEPDGDYLAIGIYGQFIYINTVRNIVIVKTSAYADYETDGIEMEYETIDMFQSIAKQL